MIIQEPTILIAYPKEFICYPKFERKISKIFSSLSNFSLAIISDYNGFIEKKLQDDQRIHNAIKTSEEKLEQVTHAVIFDDGESFTQIISELKQKGIVSRVIDTNITRVVNVDKDEKYDVYIGRGSAWGNPYAVGFGNGPDEEQNDRDEAIRKYKYDFDKGYLKSSKEQVLKLRGKTLGCHCKPAACHGDILANYLNSLDDGK